MLLLFVPRDSFVAVKVKEILWFICAKFCLYVWTVLLITKYHGLHVHVCLSSTLINYRRVGSFTTHQTQISEMTWNKDYGFLLLSEKTRMSTDVKHKTAHFSQLHVIRTLSVLVQLEIELTSLLRCKNHITVQCTAERRYNEGPRGWQNLFTITRFPYTEGSFSNISLLLG